METTHRQTNRRLISFAALACYLLAAHLTDQTGTVQAQRIPIPQGGGKTEADVLLAEGPRFPAAYVLSNFSAYVLTRSGVLMVVEYQLGNDCTATIKLTVKKDEKSFTYPLKPTGAKIEQVTFQLPEEVFGKKLAVATLSVKAENINPNAKKPPDFTLYGLCMGERGCGSIGIYSISFQPAHVRATQQEKAAYSFYSRSDFDAVYAEFEIMGHTSSGEPANRLVNSEKIGGIRRGESVGREWNGKDQKGKVSKGRHQLVVKAWYREKGGDWARAWSRERVVIE